MYADVELDEWLDIPKLSCNVLLRLCENDVYDAHAALRHAHDLLDSESAHKIYIMMPLNLRKHRGFTPWLAHASTVQRGNKSGHSVPDPVQQQISAFRIQSESADSVREQQCILQLSIKPHLVEAQPLHVAAQGTQIHYASFDFRIAGGVQRTLADSGATCCCMSEHYVKRLHLNVSPLEYSEDIGGIGGEVSIRGVCHHHG